MRRSDLEQLGYCRSCLNEVYHLGLKRHQVQVSYYPGQCNHCGKTKNIVIDVSLARKLRLFLTKKEK